MREVMEDAFGAPAVFLRISNALCAPNSPFANYPFIHVDPYCDVLKRAFQYRHRRVSSRAATIETEAPMRPTIQLSVVMLVLVASQSLAQHFTITLDKDITYEGTVVGKVETLKLSSGRITIAAVLLPQLFPVLDATMKQMGDLEKDHWSRRIYWIGDTRVLTEIGQEADHLRLATRIRYEQWLRALIETRLLRDTKTVDWMFKIPQGDLWNLTVLGKVLNIRDFPNWLEDLFDLRATERLALPLPVDCGSCNCQGFAKQHGAALSGVKFVRRDDNSVYVEASFTFTGDVDISACWSL